MLTEISHPLGMKSYFSEIRLVNTPYLIKVDFFPWQYSLLILIFFECRKMIKDMFDLYYIFANQIEQCS